MARIDLINVCKTLDDDRRGAFRIENLNLTVPDGQTLVVLGPSGCGKTTLLRIIAGLVTTDSGRVRYDGADVSQTDPGSRRVGMVFQNYALYPHLTSRANILSYFMFRKKTPELNEMARAKYQRTSELMGVELAHLLDRRPPTLSGGEKQRVAVARCITRDPTVFLLDEPFSNLDQALREKYRVSLKLLLKQFAITTVYVTHDHYEALILADLLAIMNRGHIEQVGTYLELYDEPRNLFVASFLNRHVGAPPINVIEASDFPPAGTRGGARMGVRPEDVVVSRSQAAGAIAGTVTGAVDLPLANGRVVWVQVGAREVHAELPADERFQRGDPVWLTFTRYHVFDEAGTRLRSYPDPAGV